MHSLEHKTDLVRSFNSGWLKTDIIGYELINHIIGSPLNNIFGFCFCIFYVYFLGSHSMKHKLL